MGRKKITIKPIDCPRLRSVTFYKRRKGLLKKAMELAVLCQSHVFLAFVDNETGKLVTFNSHSVKALRQLFRKTPLHLRQNFKADDYDFLYGDSQNCNKSGKLPHRDQNNIKVEEEDDSVFDQLCAQQTPRTNKRVSKKNAKIVQKNTSKATHIKLSRKSNEVKQCDNDQEEDKQFGFLQQQNSEDQEQQQDVHNEDNSDNQQNTQYNNSNSDQNRGSGQLLIKTGYKGTEINEMMNIFQEDQHNRDINNQYEMSRKMLKENLHSDQLSQQQDSQQPDFKGAQKKMKEKLNIKNLDIGDDQKNQSYKLTKQQSFSFMGSNSGIAQKDQTKLQPIDDQNSQNTAALLQAASQQLNQSNNNTNNNSQQQSQQFHQQLLNNQAIYQHLRSLNAVANPFNNDLSPYPMLMTPSPFPSSLFFPNLGGGVPSSNPLNTNQPNQLGFDFMNNSLLSSTSPLFQACQGLFNQHDLGPASGAGTTTNALQNQLSSKSAATGLNNMFNTPQNSFSALSQSILKDKVQGSENKQQPNLDMNPDQAANYYNQIMNNFRTQNSGLNLQNLNQAGCFNDSQQSSQQQFQQQKLQQAGGLDCNALLESVLQQQQQQQQQQGDNTAAKKQI